MKIVGICGSLRKESYNKKLLQLIFKFLEEKGLECEELFFDEFAPYNQDVEDAGPPKYVVDFKAKIEASDGLVFIIPEYNFSIPGAFKNALDWASRPDSDIPKVFGDKIVLCGGISSGVRGTARAQMHLANVVHDLSLIACPSQILISNGSEAFDKKGNLVKESDVKKVEAACVKFVELLGKLRGNG